MNGERYKRCTVCGSRMAKASTGTAHPKCLAPRVPGYQPDHAQRHAVEMGSLIFAAASGKLSTVKDADKDTPSKDTQTT